jgi:hypothetical protein
MELFFCLVLPVILVIAFVVWLVRRKPATDGTAPQLITPAALLESNAFGGALEQVLDRWVAQGRLPRETAAQVLALLHEDRVARVQPAAAPSAFQAAESPLQGAAPPPMAPAQFQAAAATPATVSTQAALEPPGPPLGERLWEGVLALRTRQTLLFLGAFLLVVSALILVVFNWASFPPILQFALLAAVCGGLWGGGYWMSFRWGLKGAGVGLRAVGAALTPVVAFSLSRPGLLDLAPRGGWLLASLLSLPIYALAAWRLRHVAYIVAGCLAVASAVLAALSFGDINWLPVALIVTLASYLPLARWFRQRAPELATGPAWVAHVGLPIALVWALAWYAGGQLGDGALAITFFAAAGFYLLAAGLERRTIWGWAVAALILPALLTGLNALDAEALWWALAPALVALAGLGLGALIEPRARAYAAPAYVSAAMLALLALPFIQSWGTARLTLPVLIVFGAAAMLAVHRECFGWLSEYGRLGLATLGLGLAAGLLPIWALALLDLTTLTYPQSGQALLPLAALAFAAARWWPGRLRRPYDATLQSIGALIALGAGIAALLDDPIPVISLVALTAIWAFQTILRRHSLWANLWAALAMGTTLLAAVIELDSLPIGRDPGYWYALGLLFAGTYAIGGTWLRRSAWRCLTWPGIGWGALIGMATLLAVVAEVGSGQEVLALHVVVVGALAGLLALTAALWRRAWPGYLVAALLAFDVLLAARRGFFLGWQPTSADFGYVLCGLTLGLALLGQGLRRIAPRYAYPYELVGFALLTLAPLRAADDPQHACLVWLAMALLYGLAAWRYRLPWAAGPALIAMDMALLQGANWLGHGGRPADAAKLLLAAAWAQAALGLFARRRERGSPALPLWERLSVPGYLVALLSGVGALLLASGASDALALNALGLAMLAALVGSLERREELAWFALALLALGLGTLHDALGIALLWSIAWGIVEALGLCLIGWAIELRREKEEGRNASDDTNFSILHSAFFTRAVWARPLWLGPLIGGLALAGLLLVAAPPNGDLPPLTFGLATLALLLATLAVRQRTAVYAYGAGAALVAAGLFQLYDWGFRQPQWYVVPAGLYLLALAEGLRRFQGRRGLAQMIETGAAVVMLGTTLGQSLSREGLASQGYAAWLCVESLLLLGYGVLRRLRAPFFGGVAFFVIGVLWLSVDPLLSANKWMLLGCLGLLLVAAYVLLERRQEQLARAGRAWIERINGWS